MFVTEEAAPSRSAGMAELADAADLPAARSGKTPAQLQIYGTQANTLIDNAGVIRIFGIRNYPWPRISRMP